MHDHEAYHQFEEVHDGLVVIEYPILGYTLRVPPSNFYTPSHTSLLHAVLHWCQQEWALSAPTQTVEGHSLGGVSLLCKKTQVTRLPSTYPSLQHKRQECGLSLPHMATT